MSTFNGVLAEFPDIQIDYFRKSDDRPPPLACFLTHVHTDHLQGLESFRAPFIYCSPTTRELLLRLEQFPHRINYQLGILETREVTYKHLSKLLRPIPLNTPTEIELTPRKSIRVTLIDANHCPGSVMFLIEGDGKTILYTGDIRAEKWWVDSLIRNPFLIPYTLGGKQLDNLYLDTTYLHGEGVPPEKFCSKAEGIAELLKRVQSYSSGTVFHLGAWTFGYEEVWLALAAALRTKVHPDSYQLALYQSLGQANRGIDTAAYNGFRLGNDISPGCLTNDMDDARIHLCVPPCSKATGSNVVYIKPILGRQKDGFEIPDMGTGGGSGDVYLQHEVELPPRVRPADFVAYCEGRMTNYSKDQIISVRWRLLNDFEINGGKLSISKYGILLDDDNLSLEELADLLVDNILRYDENMTTEDKAKLDGVPRRRVIRFPYARHSSYSELCHFISVFKPNDIHACVVDDRDVSEGKALVDQFFGHLLTGNTGYSWGLRARRDQVEEAEKDWAADAEAWENRKKMGYPEPAAIGEPPETLMYTTSYERLRQMHHRWLLFANVEHDFSSLPIAKEMGLTSNLLELLKPPTSDQVKEKRDEIQLARDYLREQIDPAEMQVGPLPSTWSGGLDGAGDSKTEKSKAKKQKAEKQEADKSKKSKTENQAKESPATKRISENLASFAVLKRTADGVAHVQATSPSQVQIPAEPASAAQGSQISVSESALAPSLKSYSSGNLTRERLEELNAMQRREMSASRQKQARVEAYLAASADSYAAWAAIPLTSVNDNHGEEEMEL